MPGKFSSLEAGIPSTNSRAFCEDLPAAIVLRLMLVTSNIRGTRLNKAELLVNIRFEVLVVKTNDKYTHHRERWFYKPGILYRSMVLYARYPGKFKVLTNRFKNGLELLKKGGW